MDTILIQLVGVLATGVFLFSYQFRSNRRLFRVQLASYILYTLHFLLLGAFTGALSYLVNALRSAFLSSRNAFANSRKACALLCLLQLATLLFTWAGWISLLPVAANIATTLGGYSHNARKIRTSNMFINAPLWILYDILVGSWAGILDELLCTASGVISILRYGWKGLNTFEEAGR